MSDQIGIFEKKVLAELRDATKHFSFKAYEQSFVKIESDLTKQFEAHQNLKSEVESMSINQHAWKSNIYEDFKSFVTKHDGITKKLQDEYIAKTAEILKTYGELRSEMKSNTDNISSIAKLGIKNVGDIKNLDQNLK